MEPYEFMMLPGQMLEYGISTLHVVFLAAAVTAYLFTERIGKRILILSGFTILGLSLIDIYFVFSGRIEYVYLGRSVLSIVILVISFTAIYLMKRYQFRRRRFDYV